MNKAEIGVGIKGDTSDLKKSVGSLGADLKSSMSGLTSVIAGAFSVGAIVTFGRSMLQTADEMKQMGVATNTTMASMVALKTVGAENNVGWDKMANILGKLRNAQGEVVALSAPMLEALGKLNITAEEFVGLPVDDLLERIGKQYTAAGGSADAFNAVTAIFGEKIGPKMMDMLKALAEEGMVNLKKRTEEATKGFNELAKAQGNIEKFKAGVELTAGKALGGTMGFFEKLGEMYYGAGSFENIMGSKITAEGYKRTQERVAAQSQATAVASAAAVDQSAAADLSRLAENQRKAKIKAMDAALRADEKRRAKEDDFNREQDRIAEEHEKNRSDLLAGKGLEVPGRARVDALQAVGGLIGGIAGKGDQAARIAERQAKAAESIEKLMNETNRKLDDLSTKLDGIVDM